MRWTTWAGGGLALLLVTTGCSNEVEPPPAADPSASPTQAESPTPSDSPSATESAESAPEPARPISVLGLAEQQHRGDRLRLGAGA